MTLQAVIAGLSKDKDQALLAADEVTQRLGELQQQHAEEIDQLQRQMRARPSTLSSASL